MIYINILYIDKCYLIYVLLVFFCMYVHIYVCNYEQNNFVCAVYTFMYMYMYVCVYMCIFMYVGR